MIDNLSIGEVARRAGVRTSTIRYYESLGLLPAPPRVNGHRSYPPNIVQMLAAIQLAQQAGFSMAEIHELYYGFSETTPDERWRHLAERKLKEVETMIAHAQAMRKMLHAFLHCGCARLEECVAAEQIGHDAEPDAT